MAPPRRLCTAVLAVVVALGLASASGSAAADGPAPPRGDAVTRVLDVPFADPGYYTEGGYRFVYSTGHDLAKGRAFRVAMYHPMTGRYGAPRPAMLQRPRWVGRRGSPHDHGEVHMWSPHVWKRSVPGPRDYVMYFSASKRGGSDCIGLAVAKHPLGPFVPRPRPLRCADRGATLIDPAHFRTREGVHFLVFKKHRYRPMDVAIWAVRVRHTGTRRPGARSFKLVDGGGWQIEAPSVVSRGGRTYLFASRRAFAGCEYRTAAYVARSVRHRFRPLGPLDLRRRTGRPFCGPGGAEVLRVDGGFRIVFHAYDKSPKRTRRAVRHTWGAPLRWTRSGRPYPAPATRAVRRPPRFVEVPSATVSRSTNSGSSSLLP